MKLLIEQNNDILIETVGPPVGRQYFLKGVFLQANILNRNSRIYPLHILEKEVARYNEVYTSQRRAMGEMQHPDGPSINLDRVSHLIVDLHQDGNNFIGKAKILDTPLGRIAKTFIDEEIKIGVSSRGMGSLAENSRGAQEVQDDFHLVTAADLVADPSAPSAFVQGIMEGKEWIWNNGILQEQKIAKIKKTILSAPSRNLDEVMLKEWRLFLSRMELL